MGAVGEEGGAAEEATAGGAAAVMPSRPGRCRPQRRCCCCPRQSAEEEAPQAVATAAELAPGVGRRRAPPALRPAGWTGARPAHAPGGTAPGVGSQPSCAPPPRCGPMMMCCQHGDGKAEAEVPSDLRPSSLTRSGPGVFSSRGHHRRSDMKLRHRPCLFRLLLSRRNRARVRGPEVRQQ